MSCKEIQELAHGLSEKLKPKNMRRERELETLSSRKRMSGFSSLMEIDDALSVVKAHIKATSPKVEFVNLENALGRIIAHEIVTLFDSPPFDRSSVDGYAVKASETSSASPTNTIEFEIIGTSEAGKAHDGIVPEIEMGKAVEIFTGAPLPLNADAVVMAESCRRIGKKINVTGPIAPWRNISLKGEDFKAGEIIVNAGTRLRARHIGVLASANQVRIPVYRRLHIGVLSTGNELKEPGNVLQLGEIINSSKPMLKSLIKEHGCEPVDLGIVPDEPNIIKNALARGISSTDMVITTGGTSLGENDVVPEAIKALGQPGLLVHGVCMRPGKPTGIGVVDGKPIFMLSGYPVAALVAFEVFVEPIIDMALGITKQPEAKVQARLTRRVTTPSGVRSYVRVRVTEEENGEFTVNPLRLTGSGILSSMTKANGILVVREGIEGFEEGEEVEVTLIDAVTPHNKRELS